MKILFTGVRDYIHVVKMIAANQKAEQLLNFKTKRGAREMCASSWKFQEAKSHR